MPTPAPDDLYWNPMDLDSDESIPYPKQYIDPWDLENYAYIRNHLDSVDLSSDPSSLGEPQETSAFYYIPAKPMEMPKEDIYYHHQQRSLAGRGERTMERVYDTQHHNHHQDAEYYYTLQRAPKYETLARSERHHGNHVGSYAAIDELLIRNEIANTRRKQRPSTSSHAGIDASGSIYGGSLQIQHQTPHVRRRSQHARERDVSEVYDHYDYEPTEMDLYGIPENSTMQIYEKNKTLRRHQSKSNKNDGPVAKMAKSRSHSFSVGDYEYDPYKMHQQPVYNEDVYVRSDIYDSTGSSPIYDDIRTSQRCKLKHFKLSNYGHLKIDYSLSWNNLNKYLYN